MPSVARPVFVILAGLLAAGGTAMGSHAARAATELSFSHHGTADDPVHAAAEEFGKLVQAKTGGEVTVSIQPKGEGGDPRTALQGVRLGTVDIAVAGNPYFATFEPGMAVLDLPFLFRSPAHAYAVLDGEVGRGILDNLERHNMKGLALWEVGFRDLTNSVRPIREPADLEGLTISTVADGTRAEAFRLLGATPMPINGSAELLYEALKTKAVDGQEGTARDTYAARLHEVQPHLSLTRHAYTAAPLVMNLQRFNNLPPGQRRALLEAAQEAAEHQRRRNAELDREAVEAMRQAGVQVVEDPDVGAFRDAVAAEVRAAYAAEHGGDVLARIDALAGQQATAATR